MNSHQEISKILDQLDINDKLPASDKTRISTDIHKKLPISLELMTCFDGWAMAVDIDKWRSSEKYIRERLTDSFSNENWLLFVKAHPKNFLLSLGMGALLNLIFHRDFCYPFAFFSDDLNTFVLEDDSGDVVGAGKLIEALPAMQKR